MIRKLYFKKKQNLDNILPKYSDIITVQSEVNPTVVYGIADQKFAILMPWGAAFWQIQETPIQAKKLIPGISEEVMEVFKEWGKVYVT